MLTTHPHLTALGNHELHRFMGAELRLAAGGKSQISFPVTERMLVPAGALHAGLLYTACDLAAYAALLSELPDNEGAVTHDIHISVMRSASAGDVIDVTAEVVKRGRTLAFIDARAMSGDKIMASARVTKSLVPA